MRTEIVNTHELRPGDCVMHYGMVLEIDEPMQVSQAHPSDGPGGECLWTRARIVNWAELEPKPHNVAEYIVALARRRDNGEHTWTIQGNRLAQWARVVEI